MLEGKDLKREILFGKIRRPQGGRCMNVGKLIFRLRFGLEMKSSNTAFWHRPLKGPVMDIRN